MIDVTAARRSALTARRQSYSVSEPVSPKNTNLTRISCDTGKDKIDPIETNTPIETKAIENIIPVTDIENTDPVDSLMTITTVDSHKSLDTIESNIPVDSIENNNPLTCIENAIPVTCIETLIPVTPVSHVKCKTSNGLSKDSTINGMKSNTQNGSNNIVDLLTASPILSTTGDNKLSTPLDPTLIHCNSIIEPFLDQLSPSPKSLRTLTKLIQKQKSNVVKYYLPKLMPKLVTAYESSEIAVRKESVSAMVAIHQSVGEDALLPYLTNLSASKMKLLKVYTARAESSSTSNSSSCHKIENTH